MKTLIMCFSQTGNTRKIAERIRDGIADVTGQCDIESLDAADTKSLSEYDLVGIGSPVFYYKEPFNVRDFIEGLPDLGGQHWFVFCTHGNVVGNFFPSVTELLEKQGAVITGFHHSYANITLPFYPRPSYTSGHPDAYDLEQARAFGRDIAKRNSSIENQSSVPFTPTYPISSAEWIEESNRLTRETLRRVLPRLSINTDTCIRCHECSENCPVQGIDVEAEPPHIQDPCIYCWYCTKRAVSRVL